MRQALLSATYFGPVQWFQKLHRYEQCTIERWENFQKQTYRNRCTIATAAGRQVLSIPTEHTDNPHQPIADVRISDHGDWRRIHWNALASAYGESPFFDFYADDIRPFFERRWTYLLDFDIATTETLCQLLDVRPNIALSQAYTPHDDLPHDVDDLREAIRPKHPQADASFQPQPYYQVYADRHGFLSNLSALDLLFNLGPEGILCL